MSESARYPSLEGRTVVITGGASGIGAAFVRAFANNGALIAILDLQETAAATLAEEVASSGARRPLAIGCDLTDIGQVKSAMQHALEAVGPASVLINNAGNDRRQKFEDVDESALDSMMAVNFRHAYFTSQAVVPQMRALGGGSIINMSSAAYVRGVFDLAPYSAAKAALVGLTTAMAREFGPIGIRVNAIAPSLVHTEKQKQWFPAEKAAEAVARQSIPKAVLPEDIARLALFLASDDAATITKQIIFMDGGAR